MPRTVSRRESRLQAPLAHDAPLVHPGLDQGQRPGRKVPDEFLLARAAEHGSAARLFRPSAKLALKVHFLFGNGGLLGSAASPASAL